MSEREREVNQVIADGGNLDLDFIDFPTGWAIQRAGLNHVTSRCSAVQTDGALLCDCDALPLHWAKLKYVYSGVDVMELAEPYLSGRCDCTSGTPENGWHESRSPECHQVDVDDFAEAIRIADKLTKSWTEGGALQEVHDA